MKLEPKQVAVITGGASGIGLALARALGDRGLSLALLDVEAAALEAALADLRGRGCAAEAWCCDVADAAAVQRVATEVQQRFMTVDLLINNAGVGGLLGPLWDSNPQDWRWVLGVNVEGVVNGIRSFLPRMLRHGRGHVVNVASLAGLVAPPFMGAYGASKAAVVGLSESLAHELAIIGAGIRVSAVCPGVVESRIGESHRNRPAELQAENRTPPEQLARIRAAFDAMMAVKMPADVFARKVLAGIEADEAYILTHPETHPQIAARLALIGQAAAQAA
jgi:NAD(P)-dependent dehydrogenase (short-subunit alcohol dehydrogenase family)